MCRSFSRVYHFYRDLDKNSHPQRFFTGIDTQTAHSILDEAVHNNHLYLPEDEAGKILKIYGLPIAPGEFAASPDEAASVAREIGFPVVMKIVSDDIIHKSDVKGVELNVNSVEEVLATYTRMIEQVLLIKPGARIKGIHISKMILSGEEVILGIKRDKSFGPVIMFGLGGLYVEVFKDVSFRVAPIDEIIADAMIRQIKSYKILEGMRGKSPRDIASIKECLMRLSQLALECQQIKELDINPLIVLEETKGCYVADARIMLQSSTTD
jgi:acyl-CoA synthetase (NDP forming)